MLGQAISRFLKTQFGASGLRCRSRNKLIEYKSNQRTTCEESITAREILASSSQPRLNGTYCEGRELQLPHILFAPAGLANEGGTMSSATRNNCYQEQCKTNMSRHRCGQLACGSVRNRSQSLLSSGFPPALNSHSAYEDRGYWFPDNASSGWIALSHFGLRCF
jgi:hypothetical protein